ncbi:hypothetical protein PQG02_13820 [Nostoc sp. UHCC 0926]|uniref:hypothetical protein n=1 Tax=unclassified Nostoc TaxID=2593658 RepID=UPI0023612383|nr:hypothetical protein [Nostoc sp. UHCC 0926]WDD35322.1 hypothetical protein PQG02_13820 [Nostoc sp. UHCC 0926]
MNESLILADESLILVNESLNSVNESLILADESLILVNESLILADESLILVNESLILADESLNSVNESLILVNESLNSVNESLILVNRVFVWNILVSTLSSITLRIFDVWRLGIYDRTKHPTQAIAIIGSELSKITMIHKKLPSGMKGVKSY